jgi:hypothetical protein
MIDLCDYTGLLVQSISRIPVCAVYAISAATTKTIKIGISEAIWKRFSALKTDCPDELTLEYLLWCPTKKAARDIELACHKSLEARKIRGEWFDVSLKDAIRAIEANSIRLYPKTEFYPHIAFVEKMAPIAEGIAESVERRMEEMICNGLGASNQPIKRQQIRSRYLQNARI